MVQKIDEISEHVNQVSGFIPLLLEELDQVMVGQKYLTERLVLGLLIGEHILLEGVPGLAKTTSVKTLAQTVKAEFKRIQFTPDLLPADLLGTQVYQPKTGEFDIKKGPLFSNIVLADEINRAPAKVQSALLEAMQERQITIAGKSFDLGDHFMVIATQNPIEQEGTYPLPEAQLDRFMFRILIDYPTFEEELQIAETTTSQDKPDLNSLLDSAEIMQLQQVVRKVIVGKSIAAYAVRLVRGTRPFSDDSPQFVKDYLTWGAGPRACQALLMGAKANALLEGRFHASIDDIRYVAFPVLRHRLVTSFSAESDGVTTDKIISDLCDQTSEEL